VLALSSVCLLRKALEKEVKAKKEAVTNAVEGLGMPKVYVEVGQPKGGLGALKTNGAAAEMDKNIRLAGGLNAFGSSKQESVTTTWEDVITKNPDIIFQTKSDDMMGWKAFPSKDGALAQAARGEIIIRPGGDAISAIKSSDKKVWIIWYNMLFGPDNVVGLTYMAKIIHPEIDLDPAEVHKEWIGMVGVKYPEGRSFVFPELENK
jgi:iron complex transport system substrate-binding protein